jgi:hypothetical protein
MSNKLTLDLIDRLILESMLPAQNFPRKKEVLILESRGSVKQYGQVQISKKILKN